MTLTRRNSLILFILSASFLLAVEAWIARFIPLVRDPGVLAVAVTADIAVGIPLLYYVLLARKKYLPTGGVIPLYFLALAAVRLIVPLSYQSHLTFVEVLAWLLELVVLALVLVKVRAVTKATRRAQTTEVYFADALRTGVQRALGQSLLTTLLATELSLLYFAFVGWFKNYRLSKPGSRAFSYHRDSSYVAIFYGLFFMGILETVALHLLIQIWSARVAWIVTGLSGYSLLWMLGYYQATRLQPIVLDGGYLHLRTGFLWRARVPLTDIVGVRRTTLEDTKRQSFVNAAVFGEPRLVIHLKDSVALTNFFGRPKEARFIGITVDDEKAFQAELSRYVNP